MAPGLAVTGDSVRLNYRDGSDVEGTRFRRGSVRGYSYIRPSNSGSENPSPPAWAITRER